MQLELVFDLTFVVAVAAVVTQLGHGVAEGHAAEVVRPFPQCSSPSGGPG